MAYLCLEASLTNTSVSQDRDVIFNWLVCHFGSFVGKALTFVPFILEYK